MSSKPSDVTPPAHLENTRGPAAIPDWLRLLVHPEQKEGGQTGGRRGYQGDDFLRHQRSDRQRDSSPQAGPETVFGLQPDRTRSKRSRKPLEASTDAPSSSKRRKTQEKATISNHPEANLTIYRYSAIQYYRHPTRGTYATDNPTQLALTLKLPRNQITRKSSGWASIANLDISTIPVEKRKIFSTYFVFQNQNGSLHATDNLSRFASDQNLQKSSLEYVWKAAQSEHQGWKRPEKSTLDSLSSHFTIRETEIPVTRHLFTLGAITVQFHSYTSIQYYRHPTRGTYATDNPTQLALTLKLPPKQITGKSSGWESVADADISTIPVEKRKFFSIYVAFQNLNGSLHATDNLTRFAIDQNLNRQTLEHVWSDWQTEHRGWKLPEKSTLDSLSNHFIIRETEVPVTCHSLTLGEITVQFHSYTSIQYYRHSTRGTYATDNPTQLALTLGLPRDQITRERQGWESVADADISTIPVEKLKFFSTYFVFQDQNGSLHATDNLIRFSIDQDLKRGALPPVWNGRQTEYQGWKLPEKSTLDSLGNELALRPQTTHPDAGKEILEE